MWPTGRTLARPALYSNKFVLLYQFASSLGCKAKMHNWIKYTKVSISVLPISKLPCYPNKRGSQYLDLPPCSDIETASTGVLLGSRYPYKVSISTQGEGSQYRCSTDIICTLIESRWEGGGGVPLTIQVRISRNQCTNLKNFEALEICYSKTES